MIVCLQLRKLLLQVEHHLLRNLKIRHPNLLVAQLARSLALTFILFVMMRFELNFLESNHFNSRAMLADLTDDQVLLLPRQELRQKKINQQMMETTKKKE